MSSKIDFNKYLSSVSTRRQPSPIRSLMGFAALPGMISLCAGLPNPELFPFKGLSFAAADGTTLSLTAAELAVALQYSPTPGLSELIAVLKSMQQNEHNPALSPNDWTISVTAGSQDGLWKAFEMLIDEGDNVLCEFPTYAGALAFLKPLNCNLIGIDTDGDGLNPEKLVQVLQELPKEGKGKPKVLYIIPTGQNPSGATLSNQRRKQVYEIACKYDLIILEDDPYWWLYYGSAKAPADNLQFQRPLVRSIWSYDTQGRVIRFDSMSKVLSAGIRIGFITGPTAFINQIDLTTQVTNLNPSALTQILVLRLLQHLKESGWKDHITAVGAFYGRRRDSFIGYCEKHLTGLAEWTVPTAGMFVWLKLLGVSDSKTLIEQQALNAKVVLVPGQAFNPNNEKSSYVRAAFSTATEEEMDTALMRLAGLLQYH